MKLLILLTAAFPYDSGEEFLSTEVNYIRGFDRVMICPCNLKPGSSVSKQIPEGIMCVPLQKINSGNSAYAKLLLRPYVLDELKSLIQSGHSVTGRVHEMLFFMKNAVELYGALKAIPELNCADDVTIYSYWFYDAAAAGALLAADLKKRGVRVKQISRAHGFDVHAERAKYHYLPMRKFLLRRVDRLYPCSRNGGETIIRQYPEFSGKIQPALLGTVDCDEKLGSRGTVFHLLSCSYMVPVKRLHLIAQALQKADFPILWTHIGSGPLEDEIKRQTSRLPEQVSVEFLGQMDNAAIMDYYQTNHISAFVNVSSSEGIPVSVMEACSFGIPVVATNVGGTSEAVHDGGNGYLLEPDFTPDMLLEKLRMLKELPLEEYNALCSNARMLWRKNFDAGQNYSKFYEEIMQ